MTTLLCGHQVRDEQQTHYCSYLRLPELTALQPAAPSLGHHDELLFIITHQTAELWFKLILHELDTIIDLLDRDCVGSATWLLHRVDQVLELLIKQILLINTMAPQDFFAFRESLAPASGGESIQFRMIEIRSGLRDTRRHRAVLDAPVCPMHGKGVATHLLTPVLAEAYEPIFMGCLPVTPATTRHRYHGALHPIGTRWSQP